MVENFFLFSEKFLVKVRLFYEILGRFGWFGRGVGYGYYGEGLY